MKNLLLSSICFLSFSGAFAQLFVRPVNASTDAYVYVKDEVLFVKGSVHLEKNRAGNTEASIYLREGGQLIQEGPGSTNAGDGFLSVQQTAPVSNAYAYNYWCSPVGNTEIATPGNTPFGLNYMYEDINTTPGIGTLARKAQVITTKEGYRLPRMNISQRWITIMNTPETEQYAAYTRINATNGAPPGFGFTMKGLNPDATSNYTPTAMGDPQIYEFRGRPNSGTFTIPVMGPAHNNNTNNPGPAHEDAKMTLSGNPYPSALDLNKVFWDSENINKLNAFYFYEEDRSVMSHLYSQKPYGYAVWVPGPQDPYTGGVPNNNAGYYVRASYFIWSHGGDRTANGGQSANTNDRRFAPIGQGIMFVGGGPDNLTQNVYIKNEHRLFRKIGPLSGFHRGIGDNEGELLAENGEGNRSAVSTEYVEDNRTPQLRLNVSFDGKLSRELLLVLSPLASDGYDRGFDALSPMGMKSEAYFPIGPDGDLKPYVIQGTNYEPRKMVPITFHLDKLTQLEVVATEEIRKPYQQAYLFDREENTYRPILQLTSTAAKFSLPAGKYENRFFIVFRQNTSFSTSNDLDRLEITGLIKKEVDVFQNNPARQLEINNPQAHKLKTAAVFDMNGKRVIYDQNLGDDSRYTFYTGNLSDGAYLLKLTTDNDEVIDYKLMVFNK